MKMDKFLVGLLILFLIQSGLAVLIYVMFTKQTEFNESVIGALKVIENKLKKE